MEGLRGPLEGVSNIIRFNWHFYLLALVGISGGLLLGYWLGGGWTVLAQGIAGLLVLIILVSLLVSWYVYDRSHLYRLDWLSDLHLSPGAQLVNIHAGFDETSRLLAARYPEAELTVLDFYDPVQHTEVSIQRARKVYPPYPGTIATTTADLPLPDDSQDAVFVLLSAHEIRKEEERAAFFRELRRVLRPGASIILLEHLRDWPNGLAYTFGVFHFLPLSWWLKTFHLAGLQVKAHRRITPFINCFELRP